jgi:hypothetical protein
MVAHSLTPAQRTLRARVAAHAMHSQGKTNTASARAKFNQRFINEVDPDRVLPEDERNRRAEHARKRYFTELALRSSTARARAKALSSEAEAAENEVAELGGDAA